MNKLNYINVLFEIFFKIKKNINDNYLITDNINIYLCNLFNKLFLKNILHFQYKFIAFQDNDFNDLQFKQQDTSYNYKYIEFFSKDFKKLIKDKNEIIKIKITGKQYSLSFFIYITIMHILKQILINNIKNECIKDINDNYKKQLFNFVDIIYIIDENDDLNFKKKLYDICNESFFILKIYNNLENFINNKNDDQKCFIILNEKYFPEINNIDYIKCFLYYNDKHDKNIKSTGKNIILDKKEIKYDATHNILIFVDDFNKQNILNYLHNIKLFYKNNINDFFTLNINGIFTFFKNENLTNFKTKLNDLISYFNNKDNFSIDLGKEKYYLDIGFYLLANFDLLNFFLNKHVNNNFYIFYLFKKNFTDQPIAINSFENFKSLFYNSNDEISFTVYYSTDFFKKKSYYNNINNIKNIKNINNENNQYSSLFFRKQKINFKKPFFYKQININDTILNDIDKMIFKDDSKTFFKSDINLNISFSNISIKEEYLNNYILLDILEFLDKIHKTKFIDIDNFVNELNKIDTGLK